MPKIEGKRKKRCPKEESTEITPYVNFSNYYKKEVLKNLQINGCSVKSCNEILASIKVEPQIVLDFVNERARLAQDNVQEECSSFCFTNISKWLQHLKEKNLDDLCHFEAASAMMLISENEEFPEPENFDGINLKEIYKFIGNALYGHPQLELNEESRRFLIEEFKELIELANTEQADQDANEMKTMLESNIQFSSVSKDEKYIPYFSLDPLELDNEIKRTMELD